MKNYKEIKKVINFFKKKLKSAYTKFNICPLEVLIHAHSYCSNCDFQA